MATRSSNVAKKRCINASVYQSSCRSGRTFISSSFTWTIPGLFALKNGVLYGNEKNGVVVTLVRDRTSVVFELFTKHYPHDVKCCIFLDETRKSVYSSAKEYPEGGFTIKFDKLLRNKDNKLLKEGTLVVQFLFGPRHGRMIHPNPSKGVWSFRERDCNLVGSVPQVENDRFGDFVVRVQETDTRVHKSLMAVRSPYFRRFVEENCEGEGNVKMHLNTTHQPLVSVLSFLYSGSVVMRCVDDVIRIIKLADKLHVRSLVYLGALWLDEKLDESNVKRIRKTAIEHGIQKLIDTTDSFLQTHLNRL